MKHITVSYTVARVKSFTNFQLVIALVHVLLLGTSLVINGVVVLGPPVKLHLLLVVRIRLYMTAEDEGERERREGRREGERKGEREERVKEGRREGG